MIWDNFSRKFGLNDNSKNALNSSVERQYFEEQIILEVTSTMIRPQLKGRVLYIRVRVGYSSMYILY